MIPGAEIEIRFQIQNPNKILSPLEVMDPKKDQPLDQLEKMK